MAEKTHRISLFRLRDPKHPTELELTNAGYELIYRDGQQELFIKATHESIPKWLPFVLSRLEKDVDRIKNKTASFILLQNYNSKRYAVTGGFGYLQLERYAENEFGLEVAKRLIAPDKVTALSQRVPRGELRHVFRTFNDYYPARDRDNI
jgi:uncharacterized protein (TIGR04141 family)